MLVERNEEDLYPRASDADRPCLHTCQAMSQDVSGLRFTARRCHHALRSQHHRVPTVFPRQPACLSASSALLWVSEAGLTFFRNIAPLRSIQGWSANVDPRQTSAAVDDRGTVPRRQVMTPEKSTGTSTREIAPDCTSVHASCRTGHKVSKVSTASTQGADGQALTTTVVPWMLQRGYNIFCH